MGNNSLEKVLSRVLGIIKKTGDKFVVIDRDNQNFVIMPLSEYENIIGNKSNFKNLSEKELLDQFERDIALWRAEHNEEIPNALDEIQNFPQEPILPNEEFSESNQKEKNNKEDKTVKYEDIPQPTEPDIIPDIINNENDEEAGKIIDYSHFEDEKENNFEEKNGEFKEEPIF